MSSNSSPLKCSRCRQNSIDFGANGSYDEVDGRRKNRRNKYLDESVVFAEDENRANIKTMLYENDQRYVEQCFRSVFEHSGYESESSSIDEVYFSSQEEPTSFICNRCKKISKSEPLPIPQNLDDQSFLIEMSPIERDPSKHKFFTSNKALELERNIIENEMTEAPQCYVAMKLNLMGENKIYYFDKHIPSRKEWSKIAPTNTKYVSSYSNEDVPI